jgi:tetratricopeptide (TPR) repeat protein
MAGGDSAHACTMARCLLDQHVPEQALEVLLSAAAIAETAELNYCTGLALQRLGRHQDACSRFRRATEIAPHHVLALVGQAAACAALECYEDAEDCCKLALSYDPSCTAARVQQALTLSSRGRFNDAVALLRSLSEDEARPTAIIFALGRVFAQAGRYDEALDALSRAESLGGALAELYLETGFVLDALHRHDEAACSFERAIELCPGYARAHLNLGNERLEQNRHHDAVTCYLRALDLRPEYLEAHDNLGNAYRAQGKFDLAESSYRRALEIEPSDIRARNNLACALSWQGRLEEARSCFEEVLRENPAHIEAQVNLGMLRLTQGDFERGWEGYEWRFRQTRNGLAINAPRPFPYPMWQGEPLAGKRLLIWGEQGIGDELLFSSMYPGVIAQSGRCTIECAGKLVSLFSRSFPGARVIARSEPPAAEAIAGFDYHVSAGSLARWLRRDLADFPETRAHLVPQPMRVAHWRERLAALGPGLKVGFSWRSVNLKGERALYCTCLEQWQPLFSIPGVHLICVQYDECAAELDDCRRRFGVRLHKFDEVDLFNDIDEAAALSKALDLVISAPTAASSLAAAVGVETWQMNVGPDWETHGTDRKPWHPTIVPYNRAWNATWESVMERVAGDLHVRCVARNYAAPASMDTGHAP